MKSRKGLFKPPSFSSYIMPKATGKILRWLEASFSEKIGQFLEKILDETYRCRVEGKTIESKSW